MQLDVEALREARTHAGKPEQKGEPASVSAEGDELCLKLGFTFAGLNPSSPYSFTVRGTNKFGLGKASEPQLCAIARGTPPGRTEPQSQPYLPCVPTDTWHVPYLAGGAVKRHHG